MQPLLQKSRYSLEVHESHWTVGVGNAALTWEEVMTRFTVAEEAEA